MDNFVKGTILVVTELNNPWDRSKILQLKRYLQRLINPTQVNPELGFKIYLEAEEYLEEDKKYPAKERPWEIINGPIENVIFEKMEMKTARVISEISEDGNTIYTELHDKDEFIYKIKENNPYNHLKDIKTIIFYLNTSAKRAFTSTMGLDAVNYGSVFLYKNGIRIYPYGESGEDWLGLDKLKQQGYARYLGTREVIGRVEIDGEQPDFVETSSRGEGLLKNECHADLIEFIKDKVVTPLRRYVVEGLDWDKEEENPKKKPEIVIAEGSLQVIERLIGSVSEDKIVEFNPNLLDIFKENESTRLPEVIKNVEAIKRHIRDPKVKKDLDRQVKAIKQGTRAIDKKVKDTEKELKVTRRKNLFLEKAVEQDSEVVMSLNHSIKITTFSIDSSIEEANMLIEKKAPIIKLTPIIDEIELENKKIQAYASYVSLANFDTRVETIEEDIVVFISEYLRHIVNKRLKKLKIMISEKELGFKRTFKPLELSIVIDNLVDNSSKAKATKIVATFEKNDEQLILKLSDNGKGIPKADEKHIFSRGFSSTGGSGTGLVHVKKLLLSTNANIRFIGNGVEGQEKGACFEVVFK